MYFLEDWVVSDPRLCVFLCVGGCSPINPAGGQAEATALSTLVWFKSRTFYFYLEIVLDNMDNNGNLMYNITFVSISCLNM